MKFIKSINSESIYNIFKKGDSYVTLNISLVEGLGVQYNPYVDLYTGHEYVEIGGIKWATMNIGANSITDYGLFFQWGDTQGYTAAQVGTDKVFDWVSYKYGNGTSSPGATGMTKYNSSDGLTTLQTSDDAAHTNWGGAWRMPTKDEYVALGNAVTTAWTNDYNGSGVAGLICTDKSDNSKKLFFPAAGQCINSSVGNVGSYGYYWASSLETSIVQGQELVFGSSDVRWGYCDNRRLGCSVRPVSD